MIIHSKVKYVVDQMFEVAIPKDLIAGHDITQEGLLSILKFAVDRIESPMGTAEAKIFPDVEARIEAQAFAAIGTLAVWLSNRFDVRFPEKKLDS